jgi:hypothetical protein
VKMIFSPEVYVGLNIKRWWGMVAGGLGPPSDLTSCWPRHRMAFNAQTKLGILSATRDDGVRRAP